MKITGIMIALMVLLVPFALAADAVPDTPAIRLTLLNQDPDPVEPGNYVELRFTASNQGFTDAKDVTFEIIPSYPFSLPSGVSSTQSFGVIRANPGDGESVIVYYKLYVDDSAVEGTEKIKLRYKIGDGEWRFTQTDYSIRVRTFDSYLSINQISYTPSPIGPGETSEVTLELKNEGDTTITDARIALGFDVVDVPLSPVGSSNEKIVTKLDSGKTSEVSFDIAATPGAAAGLYTIPLVISYRDTNGYNYTSYKLFSLMVGATPELSVIIDDTDIQTSGVKGMVSFRFVNKGVTDVKFLSVTLGESDKYELFTSPEIYIGNVDSDDFETVDYELYIKQTDDSEIALPITYEYRDANNKPYSKQTSLTLRLYSSNELKQYGFSNGGNTGIIIVVLVVLVAGFFIYKRWRKKRK